MGLTRCGNDLLRIPGHIAHNKIKLRSANGERHGMENGHCGRMEHRLANPAAPR
jgi:hypothetical protein